MIGNTSLHAIRFPVFPAVDHVQLARFYLLL